MLDEFITIEELRFLGCPDSLLIQYCFLKRREIYNIIYRTYNGTTTT